LLFEKILVLFKDNGLIKILNMYILKNKNKNKSIEKIINIIATFQLNNKLLKNINIELSEIK